MLRICSLLAFSFIVIIVVLFFELTHLELLQHHKLVIQVLRVKLHMMIAAAASLDSETTSE
jgi:hypothetical protein